MESEEEATALQTTERAGVRSQAAGLRAAKPAATTGIQSVPGSGLIQSRNRHARLKPQPLVKCPYSLSFGQSTIDPGGGKPRPYNTFLGRLRRGGVYPLPQ